MKIPITVVLDFDPSKRCDPPHRHRVIATYVHRGTTIALVTNWPRTAWWLTAANGSMRMATGLKTTSRKTAERWEAALAVGRVVLDLWVEKGEA